MRVLIAGGGCYCPAWWPPFYPVIGVAISSTLSIQGLDYSEHDSDAGGRAVARRGHRQRRQCRRSRLQMLAIHNARLADTLEKYRATLKTE
jgi:5-(carboxyamino)imidazole ribonucleotide mutase